MDSWRSIQAGESRAAGPWPVEGVTPSALDLRPLLVMPGLVDLHAHLPQLPNAGLGSGLDLLTWLDRYIFPLERSYDRSVAERQAPAAFRAFAAAGTTTVVAYAARVGGLDRRGVRRRRGARHPGRHREGDDGSAHLRHRHRAGRDPRDEPATVRRARHALARPGRWPALVRLHAALRDQLHAGDAA